MSAIEFIGCIRAFELNGKSLTELAINAPIDNNLLDYCPIIDNRDYCMSTDVADACDDGRCVNKWNGFVCICADGFEAKQCRHGITSHIYI